MYIYKDGTIAIVSTPAPLPLNFYKTGLNYKISLDLIGMIIYWDSNYLITIEATAALFNRTAGLCGTLDQDPTNDFTSKDGTVHKVHFENISFFVQNHMLLNLYTILNIDDFNIC